MSLCRVAAAERKRIEAFRTEEPVVIDGILSEKVWQRPGMSDFVQSEPVDGAAPSEKTTVWVAFDARAIYIGARLDDSQPGRIIAPLARRDALADNFYNHLRDSDWFEVSLDPYDDRLSGFHFAVNPSGSIADATLFSDTHYDYSWDGVWESAVHMDKSGWSVELRIPYDQLRFAARKEHVWGINFRRTIKRKNEMDTFVWIPKGDQGYVSHFAALTGISGIRIKTHAEFLPYASSKADFSTAEPGNPFRTGHDFSFNSGLDAKVGLKSNLTLDLSVNPDFGQVEVDPAIVNLTAFETYYQEKRPFFIEGVGIYSFGKGGASSYSQFLKADPAFFYTRRIGRQPQGKIPEADFSLFPQWTAILGAAKVSGKIGNGWNLGFMNVVTAREYAELDSGGSRSRQEVEPLTYYGVLRGQKEWNGGNQGFGLIATAALRDFKTEDVRPLLNKNAFALAMDGWSFLDRNRTWVASGWCGGTLINGKPEDMWRIQNSPQHYFQRPDAGYLHLDPAATSLSGLAGRFTLNKEKGNVIANASLRFVSPGFDANDLGFQTNGDFINGNATAGFRWFKPGRTFRMAGVILSASHSFNFGGDLIENGYYLEMYGEFLNYWFMDAILNINRPFMDSDLTRGGALMLHPASQVISFYFDTDSRKRLVLSTSTQHTHSDSGAISWTLGASLQWKPADAVSLSFGPSYGFRTSFAQWMTNVADPLMAETGGVRSIFANLVFHTVAAEVRFNWSFNPRLSLQLYLQPYLAVGAYDTFKELARTRSFDFNIYGQKGSSINRDNGSCRVDPDSSGPAPAFSFTDPDFNLKSLRGTMVLRWEYRPGSALYFVWTQNRADYAHPGDFNPGRDLGSLFTAPGDNIFLVKLTFRFK